MTRTWEELSAERKTLARTRGQNIIELRAQGKTYKDIGKIIGLSGSRCRDLELRHIRHLNFHKNYPLIKSWDESVRAAFAANPQTTPIGRANTTTPYITSAHAINPPEKT
jgi:hypothetical protein